MPAAIGQVLQGRYRVDALLGEGGMGAVYRAWDNRLNVYVAVKEMATQPGLNPAMLAQLRQQFQQEAVVLARLSHPHLVRVTDFFEEGGNAYLVMEFIEGRDLATIIEGQGALPEQQVLAWAGQLLDALAYCHAQGVLHRDIKPQNVIIRPNGQAVLVDFGLVKLWDPRDPRTKTMMRGMGTPEYAPPEQYETGVGHTDPRSDLYSLGATLYHALTGQAPPTATMRIANPHQFQPLRRLAPRVSERTEIAIMKALELPCAQRWQSATEMAQALGISLSGRGMMAAIQPPPPPPPSGTKVMPQAAVSAPPPAYVAPVAQVTPARRGMPGWVWALLAIGGVGALVIVAILFCGLGSALFEGGGPASLPTPIPFIPTATRSTTTSGSSGGSTVALTLINNSGQTICYVYISPVTDTTWGNDWLGASEVLSSGQRRVFDVPPGNYDLRAEDCSHNAVAEQYSFGIYRDGNWIIESGSVPTPVSSGSATIVLHNNSDQTIFYAYVSPCSDSTWGNDDLGSSTVPQGGTFTFEVAPGCYDLKAEDSSHAVIETEMGIDVSGTYHWYVTSSSTPTPVGGGMATIVLHNNSGQTVWYAYVSPCSDSSWGNDDLGSSTVPDGGTFTFQVEPGCYDLRADGSGQTLIETEMGVNVSGRYDWYVSAPPPTATPTHVPTAVPPTATSAPACPSVSGPFASLWAERRSLLGCAVNEAHSPLMAQEHFEHGLMFWREDTDQMTVLYYSGSWALYQDIWNEGEPEYSCPAISPSSSPPTPRRGFGKIWCTYAEVRNGLGAATDAERGFYGGTVQDFQYGTIIRTDTGDTYVLYSGDGWEH